MDPWPITVLILVYLAVSTLILGLVLRHGRQPRTEALALQVDDRLQKARTRIDARPNPRPSCVLFGVSPQTVRLIKDYGAVMERYAGYSVVSDRVLPSSPEAIEQALISAIKANPQSDNRRILEVGLVSLAFFLPDSDAPRVMQFEEWLHGLGSEDSSRTDSVAFSGLKIADACGDAYARLSELAEARSTRMRDVIEELTRTYPRRRPDSGRLFDELANRASVHVHEPQAVRRVPLLSSNIATAGYDELTSSLEVEFHDGSVYEYGEVPRRVFDELLLSPSVGSYFQRAIRGKYQYRRIS